MEIRDERRETMYTVEIGSPTANVQTYTERTITACRKLAESYGTTMDWATIRDSKGREVASHRRGVQGWYKANI